MNWKKIVWISLIAVVLIIQLIPSGRPEVMPDNPDDLIINNSIPDSITTLLKAACYDCHSNETSYPWYAYVAPVSWLVARDINVGRSNMNLSDWQSKSKIDKVKILGDIQDEIEEGSMPMPIYILMHPEAKLTPEQRKMLILWSDKFAESLFK